MRKDKRIVAVMTLLLALTAAAILFYQEQWEDFPLAVIVESEGGREKIQSLKKIPDTYYVFLPGYADPGRRKFRRIGFTRYRLRARESETALPARTIL